MKPEIHPNYVAINVTCSCGNTFETKSTLGRKCLIVVVVSIASVSVTLEANKPKANINILLIRYLKALLAVAYSAFFIDDFFNLYSLL